MLSGITLRLACPSSNALLPLRPPHRRYQHPNPRLMVLNTGLQLCHAHRQLHLQRSRYPQLCVLLQLTHLQPVSHATWAARGFPLEGFVELLHVFLFSRQW